MKNPYARELDVRMRIAADQLTEEFEASFRVFEQNQQMSFANTEEEMQSQNCELQEELAAAERTLEMERSRVPSWNSPPQVWPNLDRSQLSGGQETVQCSRKADPNSCTSAFTLWWLRGIFCSWPRTLFGSFTSGP